MVERESWLKALKCPVCGLEGTARMSHLDDPSNRVETQTLVDECPAGFEVRADEDDSNIFRFFCAADGVTADQ